MIEFIRELKLCLLDLYVEKGKVRVSTPAYKRFYRMIQEFESRFHLYDNADWQVIERNLIHRECEYFSPDEAAEIKCALDRLANSSPISPVDCDVYSYLHPIVRELASSRLESGCFADAVESVFKEINHRVKKLLVEHGWGEMDGAALMQHAFNSVNPIIQVVPSLDSTTEQDMQHGYQFLFSGSMSAIRNPKAHDNLVITKTEAMRFLMFASTLMDKLDHAIVKSNSSSDVGDRQEYSR